MLVLVASASEVRILTTPADANITSMTNTRGNQKVEAKYI